MNFLLYKTSPELDILLILNNYKDLEIGQISSKNISTEELTEDFVNVCALQKLTNYSRLHNIYLVRISAYHEPTRRYFVHNFNNFSFKSKRTYQVGDLVLIQVSKDAYTKGIESKGAECTDRITLESKYLVLKINHHDPKYIQASKKLDDGTSCIKLAVNIIEKNEYLFSGYKNGEIRSFNWMLRSTLPEISKFENFEEILLQQLNYFVQRLKLINENIKTYHLSKNKKNLVYVEDSTMNFIIDNLPVGETTILCDSQEDLNNLEQKFKKHHEYFLNPDHQLNFVHHTSSPILNEYYLEGIKSLLNPHVTLKNLSSILIDEAHALTVIDVNSSNFRQKGKGANTEVNKQSLSTIFRQIFLRNLSGSFVIDFINMNVDETPRFLKDLVNTLYRYAHYGITTAERINYRTNKNIFTPMNLLECKRQREGRTLSDVLIKVEKENGLIQSNFNTSFLFCLILQKIYNLYTLNKTQIIEVYAHYSLHQELIDFLLLETQKGATYIHLQQIRIKSLEDYRNISDFTVRYE